MLCSYKLCSNTLPSSKEFTFPCPHCQTSIYCSQNCRTLDWDSSHKTACTGYKNANTHIPASTSDLDTSNISSISSNDPKQKKKTVDDYELANVPNKTTSDLGKGSYGQVKLVKEKGNPSSKLYAMKVISIAQLKAYSSVEYLKNEIKIQKRLDHPHIVKLHHYFQDKENVYLILEYAENNNLFFYLRKKKKLTEREAFFFFSQTCLGIDYLHKKGILHRDLKPENLLLDKQGNIKVCDFGWSAESVGKRNTFCGTVDYMAPEMVQSKPHDFKIDIWSLGVLLYELLHGYPPFRGKTNDEKFQSILDQELKFGEGISAEAQELIASLLRSDPMLRPGFEYIFSHPWIQKFEKEFKMNLKDYITDKSKKPSQRSKSPTPSTTSTPKAAKTTDVSEETNISTSPTKPQITGLVSSFTDVSPRNLTINTKPRSVSPVHSSSPINKVDEMIQSIFQKPSTPRENSKSPRNDIFSQTKTYSMAKDLINPAANDIINKRKTTQDNPIASFLPSEIEPQKRKTTNDMSVITGNMSRPNKFLQESPLPAARLQKSPSQEYVKSPKTMAHIEKSSDQKIMKKDIDDDDVPELNESMAQVNPKTNQPMTGLETKSPRAQIVDLSEYKEILSANPQKNYDLPLQTKEKSPSRSADIQRERSISQEKSQISSTLKETSERKEISPQRNYELPLQTKERERSVSQEKPKGQSQFVMNAPPVQTSSAVKETSPVRKTSDRNPLTKETSPIRKTSDRNPVTKETSPARKTSDINPFTNPPQLLKSPQKLDQSPRAKPQYGTAHMMPRDSEFFVPKAENIDNLLTSFNKGKKQKEVSMVFENSQEQGEEQFSMERITSLLERSQLGEVDSIVEKMTRNEESLLKEGLLTDKLEDFSYENTITEDNKMPKFSPEKKFYVQEPSSDQKKSPNFERISGLSVVSGVSGVTNIDKYLASYEIEDTEENKILDKLDNFYSTGKLEEKERQHIIQSKKGNGGGDTNKSSGSGVQKVFEMSFAESLKEIPPEKTVVELESVPEKEERTTKKEQDLNDQEDFMRDYMSQDRKSKSKQEVKKAEVPSRFSFGEEEEEEEEKAKKKLSQEGGGRKQRSFILSRKD